MSIILSLIICSRHPDITEELKLNIASTLGLTLKVNYNDDKLSCVRINRLETENQVAATCCDTLLANDGFCELIIVDNSQGQYSIFAAYNEGVKRSKGDILCFMHEDVLFHSQDWGKLIYGHFETNPKVGLIGVEGSHFMARYASPWWAASMSSGQLIQGDTIDGVYLSKEEYLWGRKNNNNSIECVVVDGLWMCIRRDLFDNGLITFDDKTFSGFHCYDADICMQIIKAGFEVRIAYDILIEHKSLGNPNSYYFSQLDLWFAKWRDSLPLYRGVEMTDLEVEERGGVCKKYTDLFKDNECLITQLNVVKKSKAYKIGKFILKPIKALLGK